MKRTVPIVLAFALFFLFFIQMAGTLIQAIYVLDLMHTSLDAKVLGILFFFTPVLLLPFRRTFPSWARWGLAVLLSLARAVTPSLGTQGRLFTAGMAVGLSLGLIPFLFKMKTKGEAHVSPEGAAAAGLALAVGLSTLLRTVNFSVDYSLTPAGTWSGWLLSLAFLAAFFWLEPDETIPDPQPRRWTTPAVLGVFLVLTLVYFIFSAPDVLSRWTAGNYSWIVGLVSLFSLGSVFIFLKYPTFSDRLSQRWLLLWNLLFTLALTGTILAQRVTFLAAPDAAPVVVGPPSWLQQVPLYLVLLLFPVIFLDLRFFFGRVWQAAPAPRDLVPGLLLGSLALVLLVFMTIFTNVWGYVEPVSTPFRNMFWLPFLLITGLLTLLTSGKSAAMAGAAPQTVKGSATGWAIALGLIFAGTLVSLPLTTRIRPGNAEKTSLVVMTYNIQAGNDAAAERSYDRQLQVIRKVSPDLVALQETDTARIALNNDDYVRYFAGKLGYYSYYGPTTVTGTFGTAILSRFPLQNPQAVFTFSDTDEIGTTEAEIVVGEVTFSIHDVHPDGSPAAKMAFARNLVERADGQENVIALGDFNLQQDQPAYQVVAASYVDAWKSLHPAEKGAGNGWIDHIFLSSQLRAVDPTYLLPPESASDHPVHWTEITWGK